MLSLWSSIDSFLFAFFHARISGQSKQIIAQSVGKKQDHQTSVIFFNDAVERTGLTYLKTLQLQALPLQLEQLEEH